MAKYYADFQNGKFMIQLLDFKDDIIKKKKIKSFLSIADESKQ